MKTGYSILEVMVAIFILTAVMMASLSVFENGQQVSRRLENRMVAERLAQRICEELHSKKTSDILTTPGYVPFQFPFDAFFYSVDKEDYSSNLNLTTGSLYSVDVRVIGPLDAFGHATSQVSISTLLARQPYP